MCAIDHRDSPAVTVCVFELSRIAVSADVRGVPATRWGATGGSHPGAVAVPAVGVQAGAVAAGGVAAAADGTGRAGLAAKSRSAAPTRPRAADPAQARCHLQGDGDGQERPGEPGDHGQDAQGEGAVVAGGQGRPDLVQGGDMVGQGVGPDRQEQGGQSAQHGEDGQGRDEPVQTGADGCGHCSTPSTDRVMRAWPWPVTVIEVIPMIPRNVVS